MNRMWRGCTLESQIAGDGPAKCGHPPHTTIDHCLETEVQAERK